MFNQQFNSRLMPKAQTRIVAMAQILRGHVETLSNLSLVATSRERAFVSTEEARMANSRRLLDLQPTWPNLSKISSLAVEELKNWIRLLEQALARRICFNTASSRSLMEIVRGNLANYLTTALQILWTRKTTISKAVSRVLLWMKIRIQIKI